MTGQVNKRNDYSEDKAVGDNSNSGVAITSFTALAGLMTGHVCERNGSSRYGAAGDNSVSGVAITLFVAE